MEPLMTEAVGRITPPAEFVEWLMDLPFAGATGLSRTARIRLAGNAVVTPRPTHA